MLRMRLAGLRTLVDRRQAHLEHQTTDAMAPNEPANAPQLPYHLSRAVPRRLKELFVDETHQPQRLFVRRCRLTVEGGQAIDASSHWRTIESRNLPTKGALSPMRGKLQCRSLTTQSGCQLRCGVGKKMTGNHPRNTGPMLSSQRCGAKTRSGRPCQSPAVSGKRRCRMHGGAPGSGAPRGNKNALKDGLYTREAKEGRRKLQSLLRESRKLIHGID